jgi:hypothetical protein
MMNCCFNCSVWMTCVLGACGYDDNSECFDGCDCPFFMPYKEVAKWNTIHGETCGAIPTK